MNMRSTSSIGRLLVVAGTLAAMSGAAMAQSAFQVADINAAPTSTAASSMTGPAWKGQSFFRLPSGQFLFFATTPDAGREPWISNGTPAGTELLRDIDPGAADGCLNVGIATGVTLPYDHFLVSQVTGRAMFVAGPPTLSFIDWWVTDGTNAGTASLGINPVQPSVQGGAGGTILATSVSDISVPGAVAGSTFLLNANISTTATPRFAIIRTEGVPGVFETILVNPVGSADMRYPLAVDNRIFFAATDGVTGRQLYVLDTTLPTSYTQPTNDTVGSNPRRLTNFNQTPTANAAGLPGWFPMANLRGTFPGNATPTTRVYFGTVVNNGDPGAATAGTTEHIWFYEIETGTIAQATNAPRPQANNPSTRVQLDMVFAGPPGAEKLYWTGVNAAGTLVTLLSHDPYSATVPNATDIGTTGNIIFPRRGVAVPVAGGAPGETRYVFAAQQGALSGWEIFSSDGTAAGTTLVRDLATGAGSGVSPLVPPAGNPGAAPVPQFPSFIFPASTGRFYFSGTDQATASAATGNTPGNANTGNIAASTRNQLWSGQVTRTSPTTVAVDITLGADNPIVINPNTGVITAGVSSTPLGLAVGPADAALINAFDATIGREPRVTLGTQASTIPLRDINSTRSGSGPVGFTAVPGIGTFMNAFRPAEGRELWLTTGDSAASTSLVRNINTSGTVGADNGANPFYMKAIGGRLIFGATDTPPSATLPLPVTGSGYELYTSDGTGAGTNILADLTAGSVNGFPVVSTDNLLFGLNNAGQFAVVNGNYYFMGEDQALGSGRQVFRTDGLSAPIVTQLSPTGLNALGFRDAGAAIPQNSQINPPPFLVVGNLIYLSVQNGVDAFETLPTGAGGGGGEPFVFDTLTNTATLVADVRTGTLGSNPGQFTAFPDGRVFAFAFQGDGITNIGSEPIVIAAGGLSGFTSLGDLNVGINGSRVDAAPALAGNLIGFSVTTLTGGVELAVTDGTAAGTQIIDLNPGAGSSNPGPYAALGDILIFDAATPFTGNAFKLWRFDTTQPVAYNAANPTTGNPRLVAGQDLTPGVGTIIDSNYTPFLGKIFFTGFSSTSGVELFSTDGDNFVVAADINVGPGSSTPTNLAVTNDKLYFSADDGVTGFEPWVFKLPSECNSADIATTDSTPGADGCVNNGDFQLFFSSFFGADCSATCGILPVVACNPADIAATDGSPGADGCVDNGDFSLFFSAFFSAVCPNCAG